MWYIVKKDELYHHGVKGQKWGVRNGPPYPLGSSKSNGRRLVGEAYQKSKKYSLTKQQKQYVKDEVKNIMRRKEVDEERYKKERNNAIARTILGAAFAMPFMGSRGAMDLINNSQGMSKSKKYFKNREKHGEIDPKTGLYKKQKESSIKDDASVINPEFKTFDAEIKQKNCMLCTTTYDLRRRGYDVTAQYADRGYFFEHYVKKWYPKAEVYRVNNTDENGNPSRKKMIENAMTDLSSQGEGARGNIELVWRYGGSHSVAYEIKDGKLLVIDGQTNKIYKNPKEIFKETIEINYARLDNVEPNYAEIKKECVR